MWSTTLISCKYLNGQFPFNPLPNDKILDMTKLKALVDDKLNVAKMMISLFDRGENTVGKEENAGYHHFLLFPECFPVFFSRVIKSRDCVVELIMLVYNPTEILSIHNFSYKIHI